MVDLTKKYSYNNEFPVFLPATIIEQITVQNDELDTLGWVIAPDEPELPENHVLCWLSNRWIVVPLDDSRVIEQWRVVRQERDRLLRGVMNRVSRCLEEIEQGIEPSEDIVVLDEYCQTLREIPQIQTNPWQIEWPEYPQNPDPGASGGEY